MSREGLLQAAKQALEALEVATTPLAKDRQEVLRAQAALRRELEKPADEPVAWRYRSVSPFVGKDGKYKVSDGWTLIHKPEQRDAHSTICGMPVEPLYTAPQQAEKQEPVAQLMDMIVGNLVREGINKHRARELAAHFIKHCNYTNGYCAGRTDLLKEQAEQKPVATLWQHGETGRTRITMPGDITDCDARWFKASDLYTTPPKREWQGLTDEQIWDAYMKAPVDIECHVSDLHQFARAIEAALKERTHDRT